MKRSDYIGKIMLRTREECIEVVYVRHWSKDFNHFYIEVLNSGTEGFARKKDLQFFDYKTYKLIGYKKNVVRAENSVERWKNHLKEYQAEQV